MSIKTDLQNLVALQGRELELLRIAEEPAEIERKRTAAKAEIDAAVAGVLASQAFILGADVGAFEQEVLAFVGAPDAHAVGVANGSDAIVLALRGMGIAQGDEVICPAYSFTSTATSISLVGATPVFADVELPGCNVEPGAVLAQVGPKTKAIIAVHLYGRAADVAALREGR